jgi:hypothetical protein
LNKQQPGHAPGSASDTASDLTDGMGGNRRAFLALPLTGPRVKNPIRCGCDPLPGSAVFLGEFTSIQIRIVNVRQNRSGDISDRFNRAEDTLIRGYDGSAPVSN